MAAHRLFFTFYIRTIPDGLSINHRCDNGLCVNPYHMYIGTAKDNSEDRDRGFDAPIKQSDVNKII